MGSYSNQPHTPSRTFWLMSINQPRKIYVSIARAEIVTRQRPSSAFTTRVPCRCIQWPSFSSGYGYLHSIYYHVTMVYPHDRNQCGSGEEGASFNLLTMYTSSHVADKPNAWQERPVWLWDLSQLVEKTLDTEGMWYCYLWILRWFIMTQFREWW